MAIAVSGLLCIRLQADLMAAGAALVVAAGNGCRLVAHHRHGARGDPGEVVLAGLELICLLFVAAGAGLRGGHLREFCVVHLSVLRAVAGRAVYALLCHFAFKVLCYNARGDLLVAVDACAFLRGHRRAGIDQHGYSYKKTCNPQKLHSIPPWCIHNIAALFSVTGSSCNHAPFVPLSCLFGLYVL